MDPGFLRCAQSPTSGRVSGFAGVANGELI